MTVQQLVQKLPAEAWVTIKNEATGKTVWSGYASGATFGDAVKGWDFTEGYIVYI